MIKILSIVLAATILSSVVVITLQDTHAALTITELRKKIQQRNEAIARGSGNVLQNQLNAANLAGSNNDLSQSNEALAEGSGDVTQNAQNTAQIEGDNNKVTQSNKQTASSSGEGSNVRQSASNNAQIGSGESNNAGEVGDGDDPDQEN